MMKTQRLPPQSSGLGVGQRLFDAALALGCSTAVADQFTATGVIVLNSLQMTVRPAHDHPMADLICVTEVPRPVSIDVAEWLSLLLKANAVLPASHHAGFGLFGGADGDRAALVARITACAHLEPRLLAAKLASVSDVGASFAHSPPRIAMPATGASWLEQMLAEARGVVSLADWAGALLHEVALILSGEPDVAQIAAEQRQLVVDGATLHVNAAAKGKALVIVASLGSCSDDMETCRSILRSNVELMKGAGLAVGLSGGELHLLSRWNVGSRGAADLAQWALELSEIVVALRGKSASAG